MPLYYLHVWQDERFIEDREGADYRDVAAAREEALGAAREFLIAAIRTGDEAGRRHIEVRDAAGATVATVPLSDALPPSLRALGGLEARR